MRQIDLIQSLDAWDQKGRRVFTIGDLRKIFPDEKSSTFETRLRQIISQSNSPLARPVRGIYVNRFSRMPATNLLEEVARAMRRGHKSYISLESALSEHGMISQIPVGRLTVMTTGRGGTFDTCYGTIEFTHTYRPASQFIDRIVDTGRPLGIASIDLALEDAKNVKRNLSLIIPDEDEESRVEPAKEGCEYAELQ